MGLTDDSLAPELRRAIRRVGRDITSLRLGSELRSVRGIEVLTALDRLDMSAGVKLGPVARLPRLGELHVHAPLFATRDHTVRLGPLARAPALRELHVQGARVLETEAISDIETLEVVELSFMRSPDLRPLTRIALRRLVLDDVSRVRLGDLEGLTVEQLDLWGCDLADAAPLPTMPNLREVWIHGGTGWREDSLGPLMHLGPGARIVLDERFDPERHRDQIATLEERGVWIFAGRDPHEHGVNPSWWGDRGDLESDDRDPPRYVTGSRPA